MGLNADKLRPYLEKLAEQVDRPPRNAQFEFNPETIELVPVVASQEGYTLDVDGTAALASAKAVSPDHVVPLVVKVTRPAVAVENIAQMGIKELVAEATTSFKGSSAARIHNIQRAASSSTVWSLRRARCSPSTSTWAKSAQQRGIKRDRSSGETARRSASAAGFARYPLRLSGLPFGPDCRFWKDGTTDIA